MTNSALTRRINATRFTVTRALALSLLVTTVLAALPRQASAQYYERAPVRDGDRTFQKPVRDWLAIRNQNILMQQRDYSCGAAVLATMMRYYWGDYATEDVLIAELRKMLTYEELTDRMENGLAMTDLRRLAVKRGYASTIGKLSFSKLTQSKIPLIVGIDTDEYKHFVIFRGFDGQWVYLADPSRGNIRVPSWQFIREWQQNTVLVVAKKGAKPRSWSPLHVRPSEVALGGTNWQMIQMYPSKTISSASVP